MTVLDLSDEEIVAAVEAEAAAGDPRAEKLLRILLEVIEREGRLTVIDKLACTPHVDGRSR
jgi:hypothetical protein